MGGATSSLRADLPGRGRRRAEGPRAQGRDVLQHDGAGDLGDSDRDTTVFGDREMVSVQDRAMPEGELLSRVECGNPVDWTVVVGVTTGDGSTVRRVRDGERCRTDTQSVEGENSKQGETDDDPREPPEHDETVAACTASSGVTAQALLKAAGRGGRHLRYIGARAVGLDERDWDRAEWVYPRRAVTDTAPTTGIVRITSVPEGAQWSLWILGRRRFRSDIPGIREPIMSMTSWISVMRMAHAAVK